MDKTQLAAYVDAAAAALDLRIAEAHRPGVIAYLGLASAMAEQVMGLPLTIEDEPAPVFTPVSPGGRPA